MLKNFLQLSAAITMFLIMHTSFAFEVSGESFPADFEMTSWSSTSDSSSLTAGDSCAGEMMAGHGLMCQQETQGVWQLVGVAAWRRGCGNVGQRPRLYEMVNLTSSWVENVIKMDMEASNGENGYQVPRRRLG